MQASELTEGGFWTPRGSRDETAPFLFADLLDVPRALADPKQFPLSLLENQTGSNADA